MLEQREQVEARAVASESATAELRGRLIEIESASEEELTKLESELSERLAQRASIVPEVDGEVLELYEDLRHQKKGVGAAAIVDGVCQGCHEQLSSVELDKLKRADGVKRCEHCRRILVLDT
jgi:hypothetical protein